MHKNKNLTYLDTYVLQQDMRVRMPKAVLENLGLTKGESKLKIYCNKKEKYILICNEESSND